MGEEYPPEAHRTGSVTWYIDPIDGTTNFNQSAPKLRHFRGVLGWKRTAVRTGAGCGAKDAILGKAWRRRMAGSDTDPHIRPTGTIGAVADNTGFAIYLPGATSLSGADDPALRKVRGVRCLGSVALELCEVAAGRADLFVTMHSSPWDHNAARIILEEAGGAIFTVAGDELPLEQKALCSLSMLLT